MTVDATALAAAVTEPVVVFFFAGDFCFARDARAFVAFVVFVRLGPAARFARFVLPFVVLFAIDPPAPPIACADARRPGCDRSPAGIVAPKTPFIIERMNLLSLPARDESGAVHVVMIDGATASR